MKVLIIEKDEKITNLLIKVLLKNHYAVDNTEDGLKGLRIAQENEYDCIIMDINLPSLDGFGVLEILRSKNIVTPVLILTARSGTDDIIKGFSAGADDYLTKPFHTFEVLLRVQALIRRSSLNKAEKVEIKDIKVDLKLKRVFRKNQEISLNAKEYGILEYLLRNRGRIVSTEELLEHIWDTRINIFTHTVKVNMNNLRNKLSKNKKLIETVKNQGYVIR